MLEKVKKSLGITGSYQDDTIQSYIDEVKQYLIEGGVLKEVVEHSSAVGTIARGVSDLWNYGSGGTSFSPYFIQRAIQLSGKTVEDLEKDDNTEVEEDEQNE
ncbi:MAG: phage gp6-like head-tail connector protein [Clostridia bacterium]|nr:phage gp6-like head-tail connector protein [Clostridia bacterium]